MTFLSHPTVIQTYDRHGHTKSRILITTEQPHRGEGRLADRWYVWGYRWVATKQHWSCNSLLHNFASYTEMTIHQHNADKPQARH